MRHAPRAVTKSNRNAFCGLYFCNFCNLYTPLRVTTYRCSESPRSSEISPSMHLHKSSTVSPSGRCPRQSNGTIQRMKSRDRIPAFFPGFSFTGFFEWSISRVRVIDPKIRWFVYFSFTGGGGGRLIYIQYPTDIDARLDQIRTAQSSIILMTTDCTNCSV